MFYTKICCTASAYTLSSYPTTCVQYLIYFSGMGMRLNIPRQIDIQISIFFFFFFFYKIN